MGAGRVEGGAVIRVTVPRDAESAVIAAVKAVAASYPGEHELALMTEGGARTVVLGPDWTVDASIDCVAALEEHGRVEVRDG